MTTEPTAEARIKILTDTLQIIADLAVGHGDVREMIARRARQALADVAPSEEYRKVVRSELLEDIRRDPANTVFGMTLPQLYRLVLEYQARSLSDAAVKLEASS
jgi:hypothetical protein